VNSLSGPRALKRTLGPDYGGPSVSIDPVSREWILYSWQDAPSDITVHVRDADWNVFLEKVGRWGAEHGG
jgi:hypothetical protein